MSFESYEEAKSNEDRTKISYYTSLQSYLARQIAQLNAKNLELSNDPDDGTQEQPFTSHGSYGHLANESVKTTAKLYKTLENIDRLCKKVDAINNELKIHTNRHGLSEIDEISAAYNAFVKTEGDCRFSTAREDKVEKLKIVLAVVYERKRNFDLESTCIEAAQKSMARIFSNEINIQNLASASAYEIKKQTRQMRDNNLEVRRKFDELYESTIKTSCFMHAEHDLFGIYYTAFEEKLHQMETAKKFQDQIQDIVHDRYMKRLESITVTMQHTDKSLRDMVHSQLEKLDLLFTENAKLYETLKDAIFDKSDNGKAASVGNGHPSMGTDRTLSTTILPRILTTLMFSWDKVVYLQNAHKLRNSAKDIIRKICIATGSVESNLLNIINMPNDR